MGNNLQCCTACLHNPHVEAETNLVSSPSKNSILKKDNIANIIKLQSLYRGYIVRKKHKEK